VVSWQVQTSANGSTETLGGGRWKAKRNRRGSSQVGWF
jgi:hypothetical protein